MDYRDLFPILEEIDRSPERQASFVWGSVKTASPREIKNILKEMTQDNPDLHKIASELTLLQIRELQRGLS